MNTLSKMSFFGLSEKWDFVDCVFLLTDVGLTQLISKTVGGQNRGGKLRWLWNDVWFDDKNCELKAMIYNKVCLSFK